MKKVNVIHACWLDFDEKGNSWCEYCSNHKSKKTYLPFHESVLNPEHICEDCVSGKASEDIGIEFKCVDFYEDEESYRNDLYKLKQS